MCIRERLVSASVVRFYSHECTQDVCTAVSFLLLCDTPFLSYRFLFSPPHLSKTLSFFSFSPFTCLFLCYFFTTALIVNNRRALNEVYPAHAIRKHNYIIFLLFFFILCCSPSSSSVTFFPFLDKAKPIIRELFFFKILVVINLVTRPDGWWSVQSNDGRLSRDRARA